MKKKICIALTILLSASAVLAGCGGSASTTVESAETAEAAASVEVPAPTEAPEPTAEPAPTEEPTPTPEPEPLKGKDVPEGMYLSELTGEPISLDLKTQRPIAAMVDNESIALPHYGTAEADIVYDIMNSTANDRITRMMVVVKDWDSIPQLGNIRSTRPTNVLMAAEYNAILCHDGGPYYINQYLAEPWADHISGAFSRVPNGKSREFTEYIVSGDLDSDIANYGFTRDYNEYYTLGEAPHFNFIPWGLEVKLSDVYSDTYAATDVSIPFFHNSTNLKYNADTKTYDYYEYGIAHVDAEDGEQMTFKNVILQCVSFAELDQHGYLIYNCIGPKQPALYLTNGESKFIYWSKDSEREPTKFWDEDGKELQMNTGKTYIAFVPADTWDQVTLEKKN